MTRTPHWGITLRQAALIAGFAYLLDPVTYAEFALYPKLVIPGHIDQTVANITAHGGTFVAMILCYFINFIEDIVIAWALYVLLAPVNRALSLLAAWLRMIYATLAIAGTLNLVIAYRAVTTPEYATLFGPGPLRAQVDLLLHSFRYEYAFILIIFGIHLCLLGYLMFRSDYTGWISKIVGVLLLIPGIGWIVYELGPYLYPAANLDWLFYTFFGELVFMLWLLIAGWRIKEPA
ncbi:MAG: DUF4386 domain-containing protein [Candidatus Eremiobacteraeota bacterium]|nr:DUF4386 domain-containing protein [Candidatus Eremiobacteraeota bacterium]MBV9056800.1 DUF4386 domain-containing protein [Candidatus Eremiobacteraeota bacterium]MBV9699316.1 DUF4386 domain-containing protein [Candidatus Eremiobacteraeota bacterium]